MMKLLSGSSQNSMLSTYSPEVHRALHPFPCYC